MRSASFGTWLLAIAALSLAVATGLGALASHGLERWLDADAVATFGTGVDYQFFHSLGLLALAVYLRGAPGAWLIALASAAILAGMLLFSGGVYASSLGGPRLIAQLAPIGGSTLIIGWLVVAGAAVRAALVGDR
jgi:uncharacterized membrane protein YgdD (TMEM256/DUF423 family)